MWRGICASAILYCVLTTLLSSSLPVLDEESYLYIAQKMRFSHPYDWPLPWHPWTDSYVYAHPPLFLYWVRSVWIFCGDDIGWLKFFLGLPFRLLPWAICSKYGLLRFPYAKLFDWTIMITQRPVPQGLTVISNRLILIE